MSPVRLLYARSESVLSEGRLALESLAAGTGIASSLILIFTMWGASYLGCKDSSVASSPSMVATGRNQGPKP